MFTRSDQITVSAQLAATEALSLTLEYSRDEENDLAGTYFIAEYAAGDLTYYFKNYNGDLAVAGSEKNIVGVKAFF